MEESPNITRKLCDHRRCKEYLLVDINPLSVGNGLMLMQTFWIQASRVIRRMAWDQACLPLSLSFSTQKRAYFLSLLMAIDILNISLETCPCSNQRMNCLEHSRVGRQLVFIYDRDISLKGSEFSSPPGENFCPEGEIFLSYMNKRVDESIFCH